AGPRPNHSRAGATAIRRRRLSAGRIWQASAALPLPPTGGRRTGPAKAVRVSPAAPDGRPATGPTAMPRIGGAGANRLRGKRGHRANRGRTSGRARGRAGTGCGGNLTTAHPLADLRVTGMRSDAPPLPTEGTGNQFVNRGNRGKRIA